MLRIPGWRTLLLATAVLALRLPLWALPGLGRDEAAYLDWSRHGKLAYAPLLQWILRTTTSLGLPGWLSVRLPSLLFGLLVLWIFDRVLRTREVEDGPRRFAVAALALCPWQTYVGSILHPDDLMLAAVLGFAWACRAHRVGAIALCGALAVLAKPSGLLVSVFAGAVLLTGRIELGPHGEMLGASRARRLLGLATLVAVVALPLTHTTPAMLEAWREFGRMHEEIGGAARLGLALVGLIVLGGPVLVPALVGGVLDSMRKADSSAPTLLGVVFLLAFGFAALLYGQIKANWILPAALLLWPTWKIAGPRFLRTGALGVSLLLSALITAGFAWPAGVRQLEDRIGSQAPRYLSMAGTREAAVSSTRRWWHRVAEYQDLNEFCVQSESVWATSGNPVPGWIVSDDYGLAAQWAATCPTRAPRLVVPLDLVFAEPLPADVADAHGDEVMILAVRVDPARLVPGHTLVEVGLLVHPVTGDPIRLARLTRPEEEAAQ